MTNVAQIVGIIAEYHPFHNGHLYGIRSARSFSGAPYCVVFLSGHFVQRGTPAVWNTRLRTEAALRCGADAVFAIPSPFSSASARDYALYGVSLLTGLGIPCLACGTEDADADELLSLVSCINEDSEAFRSVLKEGLRSGLTYPEARLQAVNADLSAAGADAFLLSRTKEILSRPNNILAYEYARALRELHSPARLITVKRLGPGYHDPLIRGTFASASAIRSHVLSGGAIDDLSSVMPEESLRLIREEPPLSPDTLCGPVERRVLNLLYEGRSLAEFEDVSEDLADRIAGTDFHAPTWEDLVNSIKTRQYTHTRIARALTHIFLGVKKEDMIRYKSGRPAPYARLLGFRRDAEELLSVLKKNASIPIISRAGAAQDILTGNPGALRLFSSETYAQALWNSLAYEANGRSYPDLYRQQIVIL